MYFAPRDPGLGKYIEIVCYAAHIYLYFHGSFYVALHFSLKLYESSRIFRLIQQLLFDLDISKLTLQKKLLKTYSIIIIFINKVAAVYF